MIHLKCKPIWIKNATSKGLEFMQILLNIVCLISLLGSISLESKFNYLIDRRAKKGYPVKDKSIKQMNEDELNLVLEYAKDRKDSDLAFSSFFYLMSVCQDHARMKVYK